MKIVARAVRKWWPTDRNYIHGWMVMVCTMVPVALYLAFASLNSIMLCRTWWGKSSCYLLYLLIGLGFLCFAPTCFRLSLQIHQPVQCMYIDKQSVTKLTASTIYKSRSGNGQYFLHTMYYQNLCCTITYLNLQRPDFTALLHIGMMCTTLAAMHRSLKYSLHVFSHVNPMLPLEKDSFALQNE